jgi:hypothetical protein
MNHGLQAMPIVGGESLKMVQFSLQRKIEALLFKAG